MTEHTDLYTIQQFEEITLNTAPAIHQHVFDGWILRASGTDTRRSNSTTALYRGLRELDEKIAYVEGWYRDYKQAAIFRLSPLAPAELEAKLEARGYSREVDTDVMVMDLHLAVPAAEPPPGMRVVESSVADGLRTLHRMKGSTTELVAQESLRQKLWMGTEVFLNLRNINGIISCGMARMEEDKVCIFNMRTADAHRGKGYATLLVSHLIAWGQARGAKAAFLQVDRNNEAALAVYRRFGFTARYMYWHRVQKG
jgi:GNAT superfamily N-acetyltransferase